MLGINSHSFLHLQDNTTTTGKSPDHLLLGSGTTFGIVRSNGQHRNWKLLCSSSLCSLLLHIKWFPVEIAHDVALRKHSHGLLMQPRCILLDQSPWGRLGVTWRNIYEACLNFSPFLGHFSFSCQHFGATVLALWNLFSELSHKQAGIPLLLW